jgi:hypothetical protein
LKTPGINDNTFKEIQLNMDFSLSRSIEILERTPQVLLVMLQDLSTEWTYNNEGEDTWSVYDIVGHLIQGELTDWIPRLEIILSEKENKTFIPFNRFAQFEMNKGKSLEQLLNEFKELRKENISLLKSKEFTDRDLNRTGIHPAFGEVSLSQLISTWTVHDLNHIAQISRVMAKQYKAEVGPGQRIYAYCSHRCISFPWVSSSHILFLSLRIYRSNIILSL